MPARPLNRLGRATRVSGADVLVTPVDQLPASEQADDRYLTELVARADLDIGERILAAGELANVDAHNLSGCTPVLLADGFRQDADGTWFYDPYRSWLRFPLNR